MLWPKVTKCPYPDCLVAGAHVDRGHDRSNKLRKRNCRGCGRSFLIGPIGAEYVDLDGLTYVVPAQTCSLPSPDAMPLRALATPHGTVPTRDSRSPKADAAAQDVPA